MQVVQSTNEAGEYVGIVLKMVPDNIVGEDKLERLKPYVLMMIDKIKDSSIEKDSLKSRFKIEKLSENQAAYTIEGAGEEEIKALHLIQVKCNKHFTEKMTVPQLMGDNVYINHRVLQFEVQEDEKRMVVKFATMGSNNFDRAIGIIDGLLRV